MARVILIRHAHADWSPDEMRPLSEPGRAAAEALANDLQNRGITRVVSSPYLRAVETVEPLAARLSLTISIEPAIRERTLGRCAEAEFMEALRRSWDDFDFALPDGETSTAAQRRVVGAIDPTRLSSTQETVAFSSHGNALTLYLNSLDNTVGFEFWRGLDLPDAYEVIQDPNGRARFARIPRRAT